MFENMCVRNIRLSSTPKGCMEFSRGLGHIAAKPLGFRPAPQLPVVTLASLANHRLICLHPTGVAFGNSAVRPWIEFL
jgi:hypothetical protein